MVSAIPSSPFIITIGMPWGPLMKLPYWSVASSGTSNTFGVRQIDAEEVARLRLHDLPGRHAADFGVGIGRSAELAIGAQVPVGDQLAGRDRMAGGVKLVGAQEHLMRRMRRVGLVLIDERCRRVLLLVDVVGGAEDAVRSRQIGGARLHHEVGRCCPARYSGSSGLSGMKMVPLPPLVTRSRP